MRCLDEALLAALGLVCAGLWLGGLGVCLALLALQIQRRRGTVTTSDWRRVLADDRLTFAYVSSRRVVLTGERSGRVSVYRDEVTAREWAALRRGCFARAAARDDPAAAGQPATGRRTSI